MALGYERRDKEVPKPHYNGETQSVQQFRTVQRKCALTEAQTSNERAQSAMKQSRHSEMCSEVSKNKLQETREKRLKCQSRTFREKNPTVPKSSKILNLRISLRRLPEPRQIHFEQKHFREGFCCFFNRSQRLDLKLKSDLKKPQLKKKKTESSSFYPKIINCRFREK